MQRTFLGTTPNLRFGVNGDFSKCLGWQQEGFDKMRKVRQMMDFTVQEETRVRVLADGLIQHVVRWGKVSGSWERVGK